MIDTDGVEDDGTQGAGLVHGTNSSLVNGPYLSKPDTSVS